MNYEITNTLETTSDTEITYTKKPSLLDNKRKEKIMLETSELAKDIFLSIIAKEGSNVNESSIEFSFDLAEQFIKTKNDRPKQIRPC